MGENSLDSEEVVSRMFAERREGWESDDELALHLIHRFNICRDTMETMPAFENHIGPLFSPKKEK